MATSGSTGLTSTVASTSSLPRVDEQLVDAPLVDKFGRVHRSLRLSVTDRCNLRCLYCMPESADDFQDSEQLLTFDEIERVVRLLAKRGIYKVRLTGGEPTLRKNLVALVERLSQIDGLDDLAMTTNGMRMVQLAEPLRSAGLRRVNVSLDALNDEAFFRVTRRRGVQQVLDGIDACLSAGFEEVRINALAIRGLNEEQILPLAHWGRERQITLRFIEYMPLGGDRSWQQQQVITGADLRQLLTQNFGPLVPAQRNDPAQPANDFVYQDNAATVGFINSVSEPFCGACDRLRLTAEGALRNCLFSHREWSLGQPMRSGASDLELLGLIYECVGDKEPGHLIAQPAFRQPERPMYRIGG